MLTKPRDYYAPFEYEKAYEFWLKHEQSHWLPLEISLTKDVQDWHTTLNESEKSIVQNTLKSFVQTELIVEEYWTTKVQKWFSVPEIQMMASSFGARESTHTVAYAYLNQSLGLEDFEEFLREPAAKSKIDRLLSVKGNNKTDIARSLAIFSAFTEGVSLFSSFAILFNYSRFNKLKGVKEIIGWSVKDEIAHSTAGCWLFNTFISENPDLFTDELKKDIYEGARETIRLEDDFIDMVFDGNSMEGIDPYDLKQFLRQRANDKLIEIGLKPNWRNVDKESLDRMLWFDVFTNGVARQDFFDGKVVDYSKSIMDFSSAWRSYNETGN